MDHHGQTDRWAERWKDRWWDGWRKVQSGKQTNRSTDRLFLRNTSANVDVLPTKLRRFYFLEISMII